MIGYVSMNLKIGENVSIGHGAIVHGAIMIEPTETETKETLDSFAEVLKKIKIESEETPELLKNAPNTTVVGRLDEVTAARQPKLKYEKEN